MRMWRSLLNLLFPPKPLVAELEEMSATDFLARVPRSETRVGREIFSLFDYRAPLSRRAIWELKYRGNARVAALLGTLLYDELVGYLAEYGELSGLREPLLIPLPLSAKRRRERGFNQCELLLDEIEKNDTAKNFRYDRETLIKTKDTPSQTKAESRAKRLKNLEGCFAVNGAERVRGRTIILIDDVATTGATLEEARATLISAGAKKVIAFTIAH